MYWAGTILLTLLGVVLLLAWRSWTKHQARARRQRRHRTVFFPLRTTAWHPNRVAPKSRTDTQPFLTKRLDGYYDAIVIGSGLSGLTTAWFLAKSGKKVLVLEQHAERNGGCLHTFSQKGFDFDTGMHYVGNMGDMTSTSRILLDEMTQGCVQWASQGDVYDVAHFGDQRFAFTRDGPDVMLAHLTTRFPDEAGALARWFKLMKACAESFDTLFLPRLLKAHGVSRFLRFLFALKQRVFPPAAYRFRDKTATQLLDHVGVRDPILRRVLGYTWGDVGDPPDQVCGPLLMSVHYHYMRGGGYYPSGGTRPLVKRIIQAIEALGGYVWMGAPVKSITQDPYSGRVNGVTVTETEREVEVSAQIVVSSAGVLVTFGQLVQKPARYRALLERVAPSCAHLMLFVGLNANGKALKLDTANHWFHTSNEREQHFVAFPSMKDPSWPHTYKSTCEFIAPTHFDDWPNPRTAPQSYAAKKKKTRDRLLKQLYAYFPRLQGHVASVELGTPYTTNRYLGRTHGNGYGLKNTPQRYAQAWLQPKTPIEGLYLTGQDILTPGITSAAESGLITASIILKRNLYDDVKRKRAHLKSLL